MSKSSQYGSIRDRIYGDIEITKRHRAQRIGYRVDSLLIAVVMKSLQHVQAQHDS